MTSPEIFSKIEKDKIKETMPVPEIIIQPEDGIIWHSFLEKAVNSEWGDNENKQPLSQQINKHFEKVPISNEIKNELKDLNNQADEETLFLMSLAYNHPERKKQILEEIAKYKDCPEAPEILNRFNSLLQEFEQQNFDLKELLEPYLKEDIKNRQERKGEDEQKIRETINFFKPKIETTPQERIIFTPTNFLLKKTEGRGANLGDTTLVMAHVENPDSQIHEFLHSVINPITEKTLFTGEQKQKIIEMASKKLIIDQNYGKNYSSLLNENLIRVYTNYFSKGEKLPTPESFLQLTDKLTKKQYEEIIQKEEGVKKNLKALNIKTLPELRNRAEEYYQLYEKDELAEKIFSLYEKFASEKREKDNLSFEDFLLENSQDIFN